VRRFVIEQGAKLRPIDDGLEAQLNSAYTSTIRLDLQDADYVIALTLELGKTKGLNWVGKTLDLSKAYKQLPIRPSHRDLAVVFFRDKEGKARYYIPNALMFGSTAAVYAFNRVSRSIWFLINVLLKVPSAVYFDDFPMFAPEKAAPETDVLVSDFLDLLGWRHDRTGPKGKPFAPSFDVLGMTLDLADLQRAGVVTLKNKEGRVEKIASKISGIQQEGTMSLAEAQELHGLLNFATGYFAGRSLKYACFKIFSLVDKGKFQSKSLKEWCEEVLVLLQSGQPRTIPITIDTKTALVFTSAVFVSMVIGMVLGRTLWRRTRTSSHHSFNGLDWNLPLSTREKILKHAYFKDLPAKYPVAKFRRPWISCASGKLIVPSRWIPEILEAIFSNLPSLFFKVKSPDLFKSARSNVNPSTSKDGANGLPLGPVLS
jgi:hypothetical protein